MAILQALFSLLSRSAGKILNAIFGWAVVALFGRTSGAEQTLLSGLVAAAALWPVLLVGIAVPKVAALVLAFVPLPHWIPKWTVSVVWLALALLVPIAVGIGIAAKAPPASPPESWVKRLARGVPITLGLAGAFLVLFVTVPLQRIAAMLRGRRDENVPLISTGDEYPIVAAEVEAALARHGIVIHRRSPPWWVSAPTTILRKLGGRAFRGFIPDRPLYWEGAGLVAALHPSSLMLRGRPTVTGWAHAVVVEELAAGPALQAVNPDAQRLEQQLHRLWDAYRENPVAHRGSHMLYARLDEIVADLAKLELPFEEWQVVYREALQLGRALAGEAQLLEQQPAPNLFRRLVGHAARTASPRREHPHMNSDDKNRWDPAQRLASATVRQPATPTPAVGPDGRPLAQLTTADLVREIANHASQLARKEVELAKIEIKADLKNEKVMVEGLGTAAVFGLLTMSALVTAAILGLGEVMAPWIAGLLVAGFMLAVCAASGLVGWAKRVKAPLEETRRTLKEDLQWTRERLA